MGRKVLDAEARARQLLGQEFMPADTPAPEYLGDYGQNAWVELLKVICVQKKQYRILSAYCLAWERYLTARDEIGESLMIYTERGMATHPLASVENQALTQIGTLGKRLGLDTIGQAVDFAKNEDEESGESVLQLIWNEQTA